MSKPLLIQAALPHARLIIGVDEAGRGPLAGPVTASAVVLDPARPIDGLADSKVLSAERRDELALVIRARALAWSIAGAEVGEIDAINILQATLLAMRRALQALLAPCAYPCTGLHVQIDGNKLPQLHDLPYQCSAEAIVNGDALVPAISAASILAKTHRDELMQLLDRQYPGYGLASHKGYGTPAHLRALRQLGPTPIHRRSFAPVRELLAMQSLAQNPM